MIWTGQKIKAKILPMAGKMSESFMFNSHRFLGFSYAVVCENKRGRGDTQKEQQKLRSIIFHTFQFVQRNIVARVGKSPGAQS